MAEPTEELRLRVMADYLSSGIWIMKPVGPFRHAMISHKKIRLPADLAQQFNDWIEWYNDNLDDPDRPSFDLPAEVAQEYNEWLDWFLGEPVVFDIEKFNKLSPRVLSLVSTKYISVTCDKKGGLVSRLERRLLVWVSQSDREPHHLGSRQGQCSQGLRRHWYER